MNINTSTYLLACVLFAVGCKSASSNTFVANPVVQQQTIAGVGACQGIAIIDGSAWLYGDKGEGVIKRLEWVGPDAADGPRLKDSRESYALVLYRNFRIKTDPEARLDPNPMPHPTGLTHHPDLGTFIGNTVNQKGTIYRLFWEGFTESGNLDDWIQNKTIDDLATHGCRPEFVRYNGRWLIATADHGDKNNKLRFYDPAKLAKASKTSDPGVLVAEFDCGPFVQSLHWIDPDNTLVLAQNQSAGRGYRLTLMRFGQGSQPPRVEQVIDLGFPKDQLKGFAVVAPGWAVLTSSSPKNNVSLIRWPIDTGR